MRKHTLVRSQEDFALRQLLHANQPILHAPHLKRFTETPKKSSYYNNLKTLKNRSQYSDNTICWGLCCGWEGVVGLACDHRERAHSNQWGLYYRCLMGQSWIREMWWKDCIERWKEASFIVRLRLITSLRVFASSQDLQITPIRLRYKSLKHWWVRELIIPPPIVFPIVYHRNTE